MRRAGLSSNVLVRAVGEAQGYPPPHSEARGDVKALPPRSNSYHRSKFFRLTLVRQHLTSALSTTSDQNIVASVHGSIWPP